MLRNVSEIELMQRQPLAEHAAGSQPLAYRGEMLHGVQRAGAAACRMKVVGDDHVVAIGCRAHEASCIGGQHAEAWIRQRSPKAFVK